MVARSARRGWGPGTPGPGRGYEQPSFGLSTLGDAVLDAPYLIAAGHSDPAASYAAISCSASVLSGFQSDEVAANGNRRRVLMPRDFDIFERFIAAGQGAAVSAAADIALEVRKQLFAEELKMDGDLIRDGSPRSPRLLRRLMKKKMSLKGLSRK